MSIKDEITTLVMDAELGQKYFLPYGAAYSAFSVDQESDGEYCWTLYNLSEPWKAMFPMKNKNYVQTFKTDRGARRSLLKRILR